MIQRIMADQNRVLVQEIKAQKQQNNNTDRTKLTFKAIAFILLSFLLIVLVIIWLLIYSEPFEPNIKILETTPLEFPPNSGNNEGGKLKKSLFQSYEANKLKLIKISFLLLFSINKIWKRINISKGNLNNNENLDNSTRIYDVLENYLGDNVNMFENESSEDIINMVENILNNPEHATHVTMNTNEINNIPNSNYKHKISDLGRSLIISATILGSSMVISSIAPTLLEFTLR